MNVQGGVRLLHLLYVIGGAVVLALLAEGAGFIFAYLNGWV